MVGRHVSQDVLVDAGIGAPEQKMDARRPAVTPRTTAHLVKLDLVERQVVEHHMADVGNVDALSKRGGGHEHFERICSEQLLDALALGAGEACVVEADQRSHLRHALAQRPRHRHGSLAGVHVNDGLLTAGHEVGKIVVAILEVAPIVHLEVGTRSRIAHAHVHWQLAPDSVGNIVASRSGERKHREGSASGKAPS